MVTSHLMGGLGNYMFQIAAAESLAIDNGTEAIFNFSKAQKIHKDIGTYANTFFKNIKRDNDLDVKNIYHDVIFSYTPIEYKGNIKLHGYFQSEKYFKHNRNKILSLFDINDGMKEYIDRKLGPVLRGDTLALHVRRGDYLNLKDVYVDLVKNRYYKRAVESLGNKRYKIFVFSDDIIWCKKNLKIENHDVHYVMGELDYIDMYIMSLCKNHIIANSSFSWWGAWLSEQKNVIAPKQWFNPKSNLYDQKDIIPETWKTI